MADKAKNTTQKDPTTKRVREEGMPRCKNCLSRMTIVEINAASKLWCYICDSYRLGG